MNMEVTDSEIKKYIQIALGAQNLKVIKITITGSTEKSDGYASYVMFATVSATTNQGVAQNVEVVAKISKEFFLQSYRMLYEREIYFYDIIWPEFTRFQLENNVRNIFNSVPMCYKTISDENVIVIVMENLRKKGYDLYERKTTLNLNHLIKVLEEYGKLHAISFALREKRKEVFEKLTNSFEDGFIHIFDTSMRTSVRNGMERAYKIMKEMNEPQLSEMCYKISQKAADDVLLELLKSVEPQSAILHGDGWNNNFMYKYECEDHQCPSKVAILDWQVSKLHSPVLDLSQFIYTTCSVETLKHFNELLNVYYASFSSFLREFGCDPEKIFPFSDLQKHWRKYSLFGVLVSTSFLHVVLCDKEDAPDLYESGDNKDLGEQINNVKIRDESEYRKRLFAPLDHYYKYINS